MRISSRAPLDKAKAWSCLISNLFVLPGLGSVLGGRRSGWLQILGSMLGAIIMMVQFIRMVVFWIETQQLPQRTDEFIWLGLGTVLFVGVWLWSLFTGLSLLKAAIPTPPPAAPPPHASSATNQGR